MQIDANNEKQENVFKMMVAEQSACLFCPPCVKWDFCYEFHNSQSLFKHVTLIMPVILIQLMM